MRIEIDPLVQILRRRGLEPDGRTQKFIDSEVIRYSKPYIPFDTGSLERSSSATVVGSGKVVYNTPYAKRQYYGTAQSRSYDARRGGMWFERMKADHKNDILEGARAISGAE